MIIRPLDLESDEELHALYVAFREALIADHPDRPAWPEAMFEAQVREPGEGMARQAWVGVLDEAEGGALVGGALLFLPLTDNIDKVFLGVTVHPDFQRRGYGSQLAEHLVEQARTHGRPLLLSDAMYPASERDDNGILRFAGRHGFTVGTVEVMRRLNLPIAAEQLDAWSAEAAPHHGDYRIESFSKVPDELVGSYVHATDQLALEAPTGDIEFEAQRTTPEQFRELRERDEKRGVVTLDSVAVDRAGDVVAASTLHVPPTTTDPVMQGATIVLPGHRGHRLGLALKAANLRELARLFPERDMVVTSNEETNANMVEINERIGFRPIDLHVTLMRLLETSTD